jgi:hypothetical protein
VFSSSSECVFTFAAHKEFQVGDPPDSSVREIRYFGRGRRINFRRSFLITWKSLKKISYERKGNHRGVIDLIAAAIMGRTGGKRDGYSSCMLRFTALYTVLAALLMVRSTVYAQCNQQSLQAVTSAPFSTSNFTCQDAFSQQAWVCLSLPFPLSFSLYLMCPFPHSPLLLASRIYDH